jgi:endonuclease/exonuclease/phosphatase family metal-dependent hydrolase
MAREDAGSGIALEDHELEAAAALGPGAAAQAEACAQALVRHVLVGALPGRAAAPGGRTVQRAAQRAWPRSGIEQGSGRSAAEERGQRGQERAGLRRRRQAPRGAPVNRAGGHAETGPRSAAFLLRMQQRAPRIARALCALVLLLLCASCLRATRAARVPQRGEPTLTVLTYNVNYGTAGDLSTIEAIETAGADLVFLQETNKAWQRAAAQRLAARYPHQHWHHQPLAGGQAVLSKRPFAVRAVLPSPTRWFPALRVVAESPLGPLQILAVHLHPPITEDGSWVRGYFGTDAERRTEIKAFTAALEPGLPTLVLGDFNEGTGGTTMRWLEQRGLRTVLPEYAPAARTWRWLVGFGLFLLTAQFDHIVYDQSLEPLAARVLRAGRSDHLPVRAVFTRAAPGSPRPPAPRGAPLSIGLAGRGSLAY